MKDNAQATRERTSGVLKDPFGGEENQRNER